MELEGKKGEGEEDRDEDDEDTEEEDGKIFAPAHISPDSTSSSGWHHSTRNGGPR